MLSLYKLEIFASVVQYGSFSAAAAQLHMTQPAVSQHIHDLERHVGTSLFNRGRRGVTLTEAGTTLFDYTQRILRLVAEADQHREGGEIHEERRTGRQHQHAGIPSEPTAIVSGSGGFEWRRRLYVFARQHPGESHSSWVMQGLLRYSVGGLKSGWYYY